MNHAQQEPDVADLRRISDLIYEKYNYDFRNYAVSSFKRRIVRILELRKITVDHLLEQLEETPYFINEFINELTVNVTEMFRDPGFWKIMRHDVLPSIHKEKHQFSIWHAGCSTGEEVVTMAVLLREMKIHNDVNIVATDLDEGALERARSATYTFKNMEVNEKNYAAFGGEPGGLKKYYQQRNNKAVFSADLLDRVKFVQHDLVLGDTFQRFDLILCRNVMIYFNQSLQNEVLKKFHASLYPNGYLSIGSKESLIWCDYADRFAVVSHDEKIYKKIIN